VTGWRTVRRVGLYVEDRNPDGLPPSNRRALKRTQRPATLTRRSAHHFPMSRYRLLIPSSIRPSPPRRDLRLGAAAGTRGGARCAARLRRGGSASQPAWPSGVRGIAPRRREMLVGCRPLDAYCTVVRRPPDSRCRPAASRLELTLDDSCRSVDKTMPSPCAGAGG